MLSAGVVSYEASAFVAPNQTNDVRVEQAGDSFTITDKAMTCPPSRRASPRGTLTATAA